jgi:hypothetical protein
MLKVILLNKTKLLNYLMVNDFGIYIDYSSLENGYKYISKTIQIEIILNNGFIFSPLYVKKYS